MSKKDHADANYIWDHNNPGVDSYVDGKYTVTTESTGEEWL